MQPLYGGRLVYSQMRTYLLVSLFSCPVVFVKIEFYIMIRKYRDRYQVKVVYEFVTKHGTATTVPRNKQSISSIKLEVNVLNCIVLV